MNHRLFPLAIVAMVLSASVVRADEPSMLSKLNPFRKDEPAASRANPNDDSGSILPKVPMPSWGSKPPQRRPKPPNAWDRMTAGTKSFFSKTTDMLNPFDSNDSKSTRSVGRDTRGTQTSQKSSWFPWFGSSEPEYQQPQTVNEFLELPKPTY